MNGSVNRIQTTWTTEVLSIWVPNPFSNLCSCLIVLFIPPRQNESPFNLGYHGSRANSYNAQLLPSQFPHRAVRPVRSEVTESALFIPVNPAKSLVNILGSINVLKTNFSN